MAWKNGGRDYGYDPRDHYASPNAPKAETGNLTTIRPDDPDFQRVQNRRHQLMAARDAAVRNRDWTAMNEITKKLAKLPTPVAGKRS